MDLEKYKQTNNIVQEIDNIKKFVFEPSKEHTVVLGCRYSGVYGILSFDISNNLKQKLMNLLNQHVEELQQQLKEL